MSNGNSKITNVFEAILEYGHDEDSSHTRANGFQQQMLRPVPMKRSKHSVSAFWLANHFGTAKIAKITAV